MVISRHDGGTSGALVLSLSIGLPVVAATPYADVTDGEAAAWLFEPGGTASLSAALDRAASDPHAVDKAAAARRRGKELRWPEIGSKIALLLDGVGRR